MHPPLPHERAFATPCPFAFAFPAQDSTPATYISTPAPNRPKKKLDTLTNTPYICTKPTDYESQTRKRNQRPRRRDHTRRQRVSISAYLTARDTHISGARTILIDDSLIGEREIKVYVDPSGKVIKKGKVWYGEVSQNCHNHHKNTPNQT